jgi:N-acetylglucosaminyl-diphospho-decaprenol L-rhamnosyltransferase
MSNVPDVSALVVNYNGMHLLPACLEALEAARGPLAVEVVAVDNASSDGSAEWLAARPGVRLLRSESNLGFARAMNRAVLAATGRMFLWLNPDCRLEPGSLPEVVRRLEALPGPAVVGPLLADADGRVQPSGLAFNTPLTAVLHVLRVRALMRLPGAAALASPAARRLGRGAVREYLATQSARPEPRRVDWLTGACLLVSRETAARVGPLDEGYFMYSEDEDWCREAAARGIPSLWWPDWTARHDVGGSGRRSPYIECHFYRSMWLYHRRWSGPGRWLAGLALILMSGVRGLSQGVLAAGSPEARLRARLWLALARWIAVGGAEPCGPLPPPEWPPAPEAARER